MGLEHIFNIPALAKAAAQRECMRKYPREFWWSFASGFGLTAVIVLALYGVLQSAVPFYRPTLQLVEDTVPIGGHLRFIQSDTPARYCPQTSIRMLWRWTDETMVERDIFFLSDQPLPPRVWDGKSIVNIDIPANIKPGVYYYRRESQVFCSWWAHLTNRPTIQRTRDVRVTVVAPPR